MGTRSTPAIAIIALMLGAGEARSESPSVELRLVADEQTADVGGDVPVPTPSSSTNLDELEAEALPSMIMGGDLAQPPNPYESLQSPQQWYPTDPHASYGPYADYGPPRHRHPLVEHFQSRPRQAPLERESWLNKPYSLNLFFGGLFLDDPLGERFQGDPGIMFGGRFGWDFEPHWGLETRIAAAYPGLDDPNDQIEFPAAHAFMCDFNWLWYWTGDTRWRPYFTVGLGALDLQYESPLFHQHTTSLTVPFGIGLKYRHSTRMAMRVDLMDNFSFDTGVQNSMHNISLVAGIEARFGGGSRRSYYPWNPGHDWR